MNTRTKCRNCCQKIFNEYLESVDKKAFLDECERQHYQEHPLIFDFLLFEAREYLIPYETKCENSRNRHSKLSDEEKDRIKNEFLIHHGYKRLIEEKLLQKDKQKYHPLDDYVLENNEVKSFLIDLQSSSSHRHVGLINAGDKYGGNSAMVDGEFKKFIEKIDLFSDTLPSQTDIPIFFKYCIDKLTVNFINYWALAVEYQSVMAMFFPSIKSSYQRRINFLKRKLTENPAPNLNILTNETNVPIIIHANQISTIKTQRLEIDEVHNSQFYIARLEGLKNDPVFQMSSVQFNALKAELSNLNDEAKWGELKTMLDNIQKNLTTKDELLPFLADSGISVANNLSAGVIFVFLNYLLTGSL